jgi:hypothetical protein
MPERLPPVMDLDQIADPGARRAIHGLLNLVEEVVAENHALREEVQRLRDEIARLKGEHGRPALKANQPAPAADHSSERERRTPATWRKQPKLPRLQINRIEVLEVDPALLPPDAEFKGYEEVVVQDVILRPDTVLFRKAKWYSPAEGRTYLAPLPAGYSGEFGPGVRALVLVLAYFGLMSEPKIVAVLGGVGVLISDGQVSNLLIKGQDRFHAEKDAVYAAGLRSSPWQHVDATPTPVDGVNHHCHIVCNPLHTTYQTTPTKDRLAVLDVLLHGRPRTYLLNNEALGYLDQVQVSARTRQRLRPLPRDTVLDETTMQRLLAEHLAGVSDQQRKWVLDATAVAAYHAQTEWPVVRLLVADDAPQFTWLTEELALCWIHEGRHYKKLEPWLPQHRAVLDTFLSDFWSYYAELLAYRQQPSAAERRRLAAAFDRLFATETGYGALDERIALTRAKKAALLRVLEYPELPLHNNPAELGARQRVRKRDVSFGPRTAEGVRAWDTFMTLAATATKLGVSFYHYVHDRVSGANRMPALAEVIDERAKELNLGASWSAP